MAVAHQAGLWPVMLTPFTHDGEVDYSSLERLIDWYEKKGVDGLFADCQSSEIFFLSLRERTELASFIKKHAHVPVIASGHVSNAFSDQLEELKAIAATGVDALILITNRLVHSGRQQESIMPRVKQIMQEIPDIPLGFYECPYPFKRLITLDELKECVDSGRFSFMKDTCCDIETIRQRLAVLSGSGFGLYNANTTTCLESVRAGAAGFSGVMLNFHPELYRWMLDHVSDPKADMVQSFLTVFSEIERQYYPVNAKFYQTEIAKVFSDPYTRSIPAEGLTETFKTEVRHLNTAAGWLWNQL
ncbi:MAG: dihydrodipicolinate synthase family protein [Oscillospiraceae bacterium]|nr:dihydrodipicolinate synthase family protein [Oscillospiraceae bacterium]